MTGARPYLKRRFSNFNYFLTLIFDLIVLIIVILLSVEDENDDEYEYDLRIFKKINPERCSSPEALKRRRGERGTLYF